MDSVNDIDRQIQANQQSAQDYRRRTENQRAKAMQLDSSDDTAGAQVYFLEAERLEEKADELEASVQTLMEQKQQAEAQVAELEKNRVQMIQEHDAKLNELTAEIGRLRGGGFTV